MIAVPHWLTLISPENSGLVLSPGARPFMTPSPFWSTVFCSTTVAVIALLASGSLVLM